MNAKLTQGLLFLLIFFVALPVMAQSPKPGHVIIIVQENRSVDQLFAGDSVLKSHGADLWTITAPITCGVSGMGNQYLHSSNTLADCVDPNHGHTAGFEASYDVNNSSWDLACAVPADLTGPSCTPTAPANFEYIDISSHVIDPYIAIAHQFGFSNYTFQTNQGPSFLAHQFLFSGTSAPEGYTTSDENYTLFAVENPITSAGASTPLAGCASPSDDNGISGTSVLDLNST